MGILPIGTRLQEVRSLGEIEAALLHGTLFNGSFTTRAWLRPQANGFMDLAGDIETLSSHCTLLVDILRDAGEPYVLIQDWQGPLTGFHGLRIMHWSHYDATRHNRGPFRVVRPAGTDRWAGWQKLLVNKPEGD
jgi:hypothetical protein